MDAMIDTGGTAFICPECSFNGTSLPELISHLTEAHSQETANRSEAPVNHLSSTQGEKRSRRKPAFSHQIISQVPRQSSPVFPPSKVDPGSIHFWNRVISTGKDDQRTSQPFEHLNGNRDENGRQNHVTPPRPIAPKNGMGSSQIFHSIPTAPTASNFSQSSQPIQKNFQCRICRLTYKNFHDCTAHIRRKHEMSHAQAGRYVEKLDAEISPTPSSNGHQKIRLKVKSLPPLLPSTATTMVSGKTNDLPRIYRCQYCPFTSNWQKNVEQHEQQEHFNYSMYEPGEALDASNGLSALLIDDIHELGERVDSPTEEMMIIEEDHDDDEEDALWKYQQEFNHLSENNQLNQYPQALSKQLKRFQCPHCEHTSPTLTKLKLHIATHINVKPYMCSICGWRANLRWYIQCHARKRHPNQHFEVLQLSHEEAEQTISAYMKERGIDNKISNRYDSKHQYQCTMCQFRSNHPRFVQQHIEMNHKKNIKTPHSYTNTVVSEANYRSMATAPEIVYPKFSSHPNFNPNRLYYCSLCYRGYRWRYDVKRHHKTMHETGEDDVLKGRNFHYLEYVPHLDGLISASMSSLNNHSKQDNEMEEEAGVVEDDDDDLKLRIADARTVDVNEDEAAVLLLDRSDHYHSLPILIDDQPEEPAIIFEDDRIEKPAHIELPKLPAIPSYSSSSRPSFKPYKCPHCFYRTNWRTDCLRHIRARHKIEPNNNGYYEMSPEEAEKTYDEYEQTYGFVVAKKVLARFTEFRHMTWEELKSSIWEKIKDKTDFEQIIFDRLRPDNYSKESRPQPIVINLPTRVSNMKLKRVFACSDCAFRSSRINELEKHVCTQVQKSLFSQLGSKCSILIYECNKCSYRTRSRIYIQQHISMHRSKETKTRAFYSCSFCGYNHRDRRKLVLHTAQSHSQLNPFHNVITRRFAADADFSIRQAALKRSFIEQQLKTKRAFSCSQCPHVSTSILEYDHHRFCHQENPSHCHRCRFCSFASSSSLYTNQHMLLHTPQAQKIMSKMDLINLQRIPINKIHREILGKSRRFHCPFCDECSSNSSSIILKHIQHFHLENSKHFHKDLIIGEDAAKEILLFQR